MSNPLSSTRVGVAAGLIGGLAGLGLLAGAGPLPSVLQLASSSVNDISGPCDEAEHVNDPRCAGLVAGGGSTSTSSSTSTTSTSSSSSTSSTTSTTIAGSAGGVDISGPCDEAEHANDPRCAGVVVPGAAPTSGGTAASPALGTIDAAGVGTVVYSFNGTSFTLVSATPVSGWRVVVEQQSGLEVEVSFRSGDRRVDVEVEIEHGGVRERVRIRDGSTEIRIENGVVTRTETNSNSGSGSTNSGSDDDDDDNSGHGSNSGSGSSGKG